MATYTVSVPKSGLVSPTTWGSRNAVKGQIETILTKYGKFLKFASDNSKLPMEVLASFISVESGGNPTAGGSGSITQGLMQWNRDFIWASLEAEKRMGRLTPDEEAKLKSFGISYLPSGKLSRKITQADAVKPELNILIGSILLGQYSDGYYDGGKFKKDTAGNKINWASDNGELRLDRMIAVYNAGAYGDTGKKAISGGYKDALALANAVNPTTRGYINKMLGLNGALDVSTSDLATKFATLKG